MRSDARNNLHPVSRGVGRRWRLMRAAIEINRVADVVTVDDIYALVRDVTREVAVERGLR